MQLERGVGTEVGEEDWPALLTRQRKGCAGLSECLDFLELCLQQMVSKANSVVTRPPSPAVLIYIPPFMLLFGLLIPPPASSEKKAEMRRAFCFCLQGK